MGPFVRDGLEREEQVFTATKGANLDALREELGDDAQRIDLIDTNDWVAAPLRTPPGHPAAGRGAAGGDRAARRRRAALGGLGSGAAGMGAPGVDHQPGPRRRSDEVRVPVRRRGPARRGPGARRAHPSRASARNRRRSVSVVRAAGRVLARHGTRRARVGGRPPAGGAGVPPRAGRAGARRGAPFAAGRGLRNSRQRATDQRHPAWAPADSGPALVRGRRARLPCHRLRQRDHRSAGRLAPAGAHLQHRLGATAGPPALRCPGRRRDGLGDRRPRARRARGARSASW